MRKFFTFKKKKRVGIIRHILKDILIMLFALGFFGTGVFIIWAVNLEIPDFNSIGERKVTQSTKIYDRTGEILLYDVHENIKRTLVSFEEIAPHARYAAVAIEDAEFYQHKGIRPLSFLRAALINLGSGEYSQGGSTITQQLVKNTLLTPEKKISRKLKEWVIALKLEQTYNKQEILTLYLNEAPYGGNIYGIEEASRRFFTKQTIDISIAEAAYLAALPQAPTFFSPYGNNKDRLDLRQKTVLNKMYSLGYITNREYTDALAEEVDFHTPTGNGIEAPHFVTWVREALVNEFGEQAIIENGYRVITTLDYELQKKAEEVVKRYGEENVLKYNANNAGMVATDPKTGDVLVMIGSRDYFNTENEGNFNITLAHRQPGSSFKPFVYAAAFNKGLTPETVVFDLKTEFQTTCGPDGKPLKPETDPDECYTPRNYDNVYRGPISLRDALAQSVNVPAIKALYIAGLNESLKVAQNLGVESLTDASRYGLTLVLGGGEVTLLEMTSAYGVFANEGTRVPQRKILRIEDSNGNIIKEYASHKNAVQVLPKNTAYAISDVLSDNIARTPAFGSRSYLHFEGYDVAVKTGTTNDYKDAWIIGYTPSFSLGTWVGNNDNTSMEKKVAGFIVAPMWNEVMNIYLASSTKETFPPMAAVSPNLKPILQGEWRGGETYTIDSISGKLATEHTPKELQEDKIITNIHNILHWVKKSNPLGEIPKNPSIDSQYNLWEIPVLTWATKTGASSTGTIKPTEFDDIHTPDTIPKISILSPEKYSLHEVNTPITVEVKIKKKYSISKVSYYLNNRFLGSSTRHPYQFTFTPKNLQHIQQTNTLRIEVTDSVFNKGIQSQTILFNIPPQVVGIEDL